MKLTNGEMAKLYVGRDVPREQVMKEIAGKRIAKLIIMSRCPGADATIVGGTALFCWTSSQLLGWPLQARAPEYPLEPGGADPAPGGQGRPLAGVGQSGTAECRFG